MKSVLGTSGTGVFIRHSSSNLLFIRLCASSSFENIPGFHTVLFNLNSYCTVHSTTGRNVHSSDMPCPPVPITLTNFFIGCYSDGRAMAERASGSIYWKSTVHQGVYLRKVIERFYKHYKNAPQLSRNHCAKDHLFCILFTFGLVMLAVQEPTEAPLSFWEKWIKYGCRHTRKV